MREAKAVAKMNPPVPVTPNVVVTLEMTVEQAAHLKRFLGAVGGNTLVRDVINPLYNALSRLSEVDKIVVAPYKFSSNKLSLYTEHDVPSKEFSS